MLLLDYGAIADLRKKMAGGPPAPQNALMGAPPTPPPPQVNPAIPGVPPIMEPPPEVYQRAMVSQGPGGLLARPEAPAEYTGMFSREELAQATPGRVQSLLGRLIGESPQNIMRMNLDEMAQRKENVSKYKTGRERQATMAALRARFAPQPNETQAQMLQRLKAYSLEAAIAGDPAAAQLAGLVNSLEPPAPESATVVMSPGQSLRDKATGREITSIPSIDKGVPQFEERGHLGGVAKFKDGVFDSWVIRPEREKDQAARPVKAPTEAQEKSALYLGMMDNALPTIRETVGKIRPEMMALIRRDPSKLATAALTSDERRFFRAAREFTAAVLRKETGATIQPFEIVDAIDRYVDSGFDDPGTRRDKAAARENYRNLIARSARPALAYYGEDTASATAEDYDRAFAALGSNASAADVEAWIKKNPRKP